MARPWERLFIALARLCAWCVILTPFGVVSVIVIAAVAGQQQPDRVFFLGNLVVELFATLFVAIVYVACNLIVDLVQAAVDPRIRLR